MKRYFIDIDATLTQPPGAPGAPVRKASIARVKKLIAAGEFVCIWSGRGDAYAKRFCLDNGLRPNLMLCKPDIIVDDRPDIRRIPHTVYVSPEDFEKGAV